MTRIPVASSTAPPSRAGSVASVGNRHPNPGPPDGGRRRRRAAARSARLSLEALEARELLSTGSNLPWYPSLMAFEHADSGRSHVFDQAYFGGSLTGPNAVNERISLDRFPAGYNVAYKDSQTMFVYGGANPNATGATGSFVARVDPITLRTVWKNQLIDTSKNGQWNWPGVLSVMSDGNLYVIYGYHLAKLDPTDGHVIADVALPTGGWFPGDTVFNGLDAFSDGTLVAKTMYRLHNDPGSGIDSPDGPPTQSIILAIDPRTLQVRSQIVAPDFLSGRITATTFNGRDYAYVAGSTSIHRFLWADGQLTLDSSWAPGNIYLPGQTAPTSPVVMRDWIVFHTDAQAATAPVSVWAINQADASVRYTIQPFAQYPLLSGHAYLAASSVSADPVSGLIYTMDSGPGYIGAVKLAPGGLQLVWSARQVTSEFFALIGPPDRRVEVSTSWFDRNHPIDEVVWRNAATGQVLARSAPLPGVMHGIMVQPGYHGNMMYLGMEGALIELSPRPTSGTGAPVPAVDVVATGGAGGLRPIQVVVPNTDWVQRRITVHCPCTPAGALPSARTSTVQVYTGLPAAPRIDGRLVIEPNGGPGSDLLDAIFGYDPRFREGGLGGAP